MSNFVRHLKTHRQKLKMKLRTGLYSVMLFIW